MVRSPMTEDELKGFGLEPSPRQHSFSEEWHIDALEAVNDGYPVMVTGRRNRARIT